MKRKKQVFWIVLIVFYVGFIFHNSLTPAVESSKQSGSVLAAILTVLQAIGLDGSMVTEHLVRKMAHFAEYYLLGVLLWNCLKTFMMNSRLWTAIQLWLITVIPLTDETFQLFTEGRSGQVSDVWLDISGAVLGSLCMLGVWYLTYYYREKNSAAAARKGIKVLKKGKGQ